MTRRIRPWLTHASALALLSSCHSHPATAPLRSQAYDREVTAAVQTELAREYLVRDREISAQSNQGIVTLTGDVQNLLVRRRAQEIAERVGGVRGVVNLLHVIPAVGRSDQTLQRDAVEALLYSPATAALNLDVQVQQGRATLRGSVGSAAQAELATQAVESVEGMKAVSSQLRLADQAARSDQQIQLEIQARLRADPEVDAGLLELRVHDGQVQMSGTVGRLAERNRAAADAWVRGVKEVDVRDVQIEPWARDDRRRTGQPEIADAEIEQAVSLELAYDPRVSRSDVEVDVVNGAVLLRGMVPTVEAKRAAGADARSTLAVHHVDNQILVQPLPLNDAQQSAEIERALARHPFTDRSAIQVEVQDDVATLEGQVSSLLERELADQLAAEAHGIQGVRNELRIVPPSVASGSAPLVGVLHQDSTRQDIAGQGERVLPAESIVLARCEERQRCGALGPGEQYQDMASCRADVANTQRYQLDALRCDAGIEQANLAQCLDQVRTADCATPRSRGEWLGSSCTPDRICRGAP